MTDTSPVPGDGPTERERLAAAIIDHQQPEQNALTKPEAAIVMVQSDPKFFVCADALALADALLASDLLAARTPAPSATQALSHVRQRISEDYELADAVLPRAAVEHYLAEADRLDAAPTDPGTRRVEVEQRVRCHVGGCVDHLEGMHVNSVGDAIHHIGCDDCTGDGWIAHQNYRARLRTPGTTEASDA